MNRFFRCFCINRFGMGSLQYHSSRSDFGFKFAEIFVFEKRLPAIKDTGSRRLRVSVIRGVADSPYQWCAESLTPRINDTGSRLLNFLKENSPYRWYGESSTPRISEQWVADSPYPWVGESTTLRITDTESWRLRVSLSRGVNTPRIGESRGVAIW
jgi:hypothetical protein